MDDARFDRLAAMALRPPRRAADARHPGAPDSAVRDRYRGALLAGAAGDALGRPMEGRTNRTGRRVTEFERWRGWAGGPTGTITDDTQLTMAVAECLLVHGAVDPDDLARRLVAWLPEGRGKGQATVEAVTRLSDGTPWWEAGAASDGNGAAMRVAPIGLAFPHDHGRLRDEAALSAVVTHSSPMAVAGAVVQALAVALAVRAPSGDLDPDAFVAALVAGTADLHDPGAPERRPEADGTPVRLVDRIAEVPSLLHLPPDEAFDRLYNGAFVLESLPSALWCFLRSPDDVEQVLVTAASGGHDADTVAAMAGNLAGAHVGVSGIPARWLGDLEFADELTAMADGLADLAGVLPEA